MSSITSRRAGDAARDGRRRTSRLDGRGCPATGATDKAAQAYEAALAALQTWRGNAEEHVAFAVQSAPAFVMAHAMRAHLSLCTRDPRRVERARRLLDDAAHLRGNEREQLHMAALRAAAAGDYEAASDTLDQVLAKHPRDALALHVANTFDYFTGNAARMLARVEAAWPAWSADVPGYAAMLTSHAFALEECGHYARAEEAARLALEIDPLDIRAHHVMAHVFEMTDRPAEGVRWMTQHTAHTGADRLFSTHCRWHLALFHLALSQTDQALTLHDDFFEAGSSAEVADLIDAAALLWRIRLQGGSVRSRAIRLADAWAPHIDDGFCTFNDVHAMLAFVAADDWDRAERLMTNLMTRRSPRMRYDRVSSQIGVPACRALIAFGRGDLVLATTLLAGLPAQAHRLGGSHAQRDVLNLTLLRAIEGIRRPARPYPARSTLRTPAPAPASRLQAASRWRA